MMLYFKNCSVQKRPLERCVEKTPMFTREHWSLLRRTLESSDMKIGVFTKRKYNN